MAKKEITKYNNDLNHLAFRRFNANELDLFFSICTQHRDLETKTVEYTFSEIAEIAGLKKVSSDKLANMLESTYDKMIELNFKIGNERNFTKFVLFTEYTLNRDEETITISVNEKFSYLLNSLTSNFTRFELKEFVDLKSSYAKEAYRHLKHFRSTGQWVVKLEEFKRLLDVPGSYKMGDLDKRVLNHIENELSKVFSNFKIEKVKRRGRGRGGVVDKLVFTFDKETIVNNNKHKVVSSKVCKDPDGYEYTSDLLELSKKRKPTKKLTKFHNFDQQTTGKKSDEEIISMFRELNKD